MSCASANWSRNIVAAYYPTWPLSKPMNCGLNQIAGDELQGADSTIVSTATAVVATSPPSSLLPPPQQPLLQRPKTERKATSGRDSDEQMITVHYK